MSSSKRNGKSKALTEENVRDHVNNYTMQTRKQLTTTKLAKPRTVDNVNRNTGRLLGKNSLSKPNRRGKKIKQQMHLNQKTANSVKKVVTTHQMVITLMMMMMTTTTMKTSTKTTMITTTMTTTNTKTTMQMTMQTMMPTMTTTTITAIAIS